jgi:hypothetical protein
LDFRVVLETDSLKILLRIRAAASTIAPQINIVARIPIAEARLPIRGEPIGVPPMKIIR